ncbi:MAG TPA: hypothetical protein VK701_06005 [Solirubrobacteraceae bacterium]|nr:hypothetical protein [Solirubrobacteraceae bacterium]
MPRASEARVWWADVEDVRERIERRRADERRMTADARTEAVPAMRRGVREIRPGQRLMLVERFAPPPRDSRRRPRLPVAQRVGPRPDRIAAWAVVLGFLLVAIAMLSAH